MLEKGKPEGKDLIEKGKAKAAALKGMDGFGKGPPMGKGPPPDYRPPPPDESDEEIGCCGGKKKKPNAAAVAAGGAAGRISQQHRQTTSERQLRSLVRELSEVQDKEKMEAGKGHEAELPSGRSLKGKGEGMNGAVSPEEIE